VITGRGPGAPGITPGLEFTRGRGSPGGTGQDAVDLSEIRRSDELISRLAARRCVPWGSSRRMAGGSGGSSPRVSGWEAGCAAGVSPPSGRMAGGSGGSSPRADTDPALSVLAALVADVDSSPGPASRPVAGRSAPQPGRAARPAADGSAGGVVAWLRAAVMGAVVAGLAGTTSLVAASVLARLYRVTGGRAGAAAPYRAPSRPRRYR
jgi:hypothetical protein